MVLDLLINAEELCLISALGFGFISPTALLISSLKNLSIILLSCVGICKASQSVDLFPSICPEVVVRDARLEDCWEVADTHCSSFFPDYTFPVDLVLRIDRFVALLSGFSVPPGCMRTCLVAVTGTSVNDNIYVGWEDFKVGGFEGRFSFNKGSVAGILTVDTVADFLPRKGPLRQRRLVIFPCSKNCGCSDS